MHLPQILSRYSFVVIEAWKGDVRAGDTISFAKYGGRLPSGGWVSIAGDPVVSEGETIVLFLQRGTSGIWKNEWGFSGYDGYVRVERGKGYGVHCNGRSRTWFRKRVIEAARESAQRGRD